MPGQSLTQIIGGPCLITYRGGTFRSKGDVTLDLKLRTFAVETAILSQVDERVSDHPATIKFVPDGEWSSLQVLFPYASVPFGDLITPQRSFGTIVSNAINSPNHNLIAGDAVYVNAYGGTITNGLSAGVLYYVHPVSADAFTIHTTYANAVAGTNPITVSSGTGTTRAVVNNPLTIQGLDGKLTTFFNAAVAQMPSIEASAVRTLLGEVTFEAFLVDGQDWSGTNSLYSVVNNPWPGDPSFNPANILTGEIYAVWGASTPWNLFTSKTGFRVDFQMQLEPYVVDNVGTISRRYSGLVVTAKAIPIGIDVSDLATALYLQGASAGRGRSLSNNSANLNISASANNFGVKLFNAALRGGPSIWSNRIDRVGELEWVATRSYNAGVPQPLFYVGTTSVS